MEAPARVQVLGRQSDHLHRVFDNSLAPVLTVERGQTVVFECPRCALPEGATVADFHLLSDDYPHNIVGPVAVAGARPGDALEVEVLHLEPMDEVGQCLVIPGFGLLADEFREPYIHHFRLLPGGVARMRPGIEVPVRPFCGIMGVAPREPGPHLTTPPRPSGGNMDNTLLVAGSRLLLPVFVEGALFSCGDGHAAQGAGEVCGTAIEISLRATLRLGLREGAGVAEPQAWTPGPARPRGGSAVTTSAGPDLLQCSRNAVRYMVDRLTRERGLSRPEAYVLCSVAGDLRVEEVVDRPSWLVSFSLADEVFTGR